MAKVPTELGLAFDRYSRRDDRDDRHVIRSEIQFDQFGSEQAKVARGIPLPHRGKRRSGSTEDELPDAVDACQFVGRKRNAWLIEVAIDISRDVGTGEKEKLNPWMMKRLIEEHRKSRGGRACDDERRENPKVACEGTRAVQASRVASPSMPVSAHHDHRISTVNCSWYHPVAFVANPPLTPSSNKPRSPLGPITNRTPG